MKFLSFLGGRNSVSGILVYLLQLHDILSSAVRYSLISLLYKMENVLMIVILPFRTRALKRHLLSHRQREPTISPGCVLPEARPEL